MATWNRILTKGDSLEFEQNNSTIDYGSSHNTLNVDGEYFGETITVGTAPTSNLGAGKVAVCAGGTWVVADKDTEAHGKGLLGVMTGANVSNAHPVNGYLIHGLVVVDGLEASGNVGDVVYIGDDGDLVHTAPTGSGNIVRPVGYIAHVSNRIIYFNPDKTWVTLI